MIIQYIGNGGSCEKLSYFEKEYRRRLQKCLSENWHEGDRTHQGVDELGTPCIWDQRRADIYRRRIAGE